jgi:hypothetical protein
MDDEQTIILNRSFTPTWAIVVSLTVIPVFPLVFLCRETETLTFELSADGSGTRVHVSGLADVEIRRRIRTATSGGLWLHRR